MEGSRPRPGLKIICVWVAPILPGIGGCTQITNTRIHQPLAPKFPSLLMSVNRALPLLSAPLACLLHASVGGRVAHVLLLLLEVLPPRPDDIITRL